MAEYPALPLFTDAYMADTRHLTTIQHGAYLLMLMTAWRMPDCALPDDDVFLSRITGLDKRTWNANKATILAFWKKDDQQKWVQGRLKDERNYVEQLRNKNAAAGKASALKRQNRHSTTVQPELNETSTPTPTPIPIPKESKKESKGLVRASRGTRLPANWILEQEWGDWAMDQGMTGDAVVKEAAKFKDYWHSKSGAAATKTDWQATWRNWIRKHLEEYAK